MDILGVMYPLTPFSTIGYTRNHEAVIKEIERWDGRRFDYRPRNEFEERYAYYPAEIVERIRNQVSLSALEALVDRPRHEARGPQVDHPRQRGLLELPAAAAARSRRGACPASATRTGAAPLAGERTPDERNAEQRAQFFCHTDLLTRSARGVHGRQPRQLRHLRARPARPGRLRVRHRPGRRPAARQGRARRRARHAAHAGRRDRRPRHHQQQRSRARAWGRW